MKSGDWDLSLSLQWQEFSLSNVKIDRDDSRVTSRTWLFQKIWDEEIDLGGGI